MLLGKHPVSTIWLYSSDVAKAARFYCDVLGIPPIEIAEDYAHFDAGGIRISIHHHDTEVNPRGAFYVWYVEKDVDRVVNELQRRGLVLAEPLKEHPFGRPPSFTTPTGINSGSGNRPVAGTRASDASSYSYDTTKISQGS